MEKYLLTFSKQARKDAKLLDREKLSDKVKDLLEILEIDPLRNPPPYEKLHGELEGMYSRRINSKHRIVYEIRGPDSTEYRGIVYIVRMRTHYKGMLSLLFL